MLERLEDRRLLTVAPLWDATISGAMNSGTMNSGTMNSGTMNSGAMNSGAMNSGAMNSGAADLLSLNFGLGGSGGSSWLSGSPDGPTEAVWISNVTDTVEGGTGGFRVSRSNWVPAMSVYYEVVVGSSAIPNTDYYALSGSVEFTAGQSETDIVVSTIEDLFPEDTETILLRLIGTSRPQAVSPSLDVHTLSIEDDDPVSAPVVTVSSTTDAYEGQSNGRIVFLRSGSRAEPLTFQYRISLSSGLAYETDFLLSTPSFDAVSLLGTAVFAGGESTVSIDVIAIDDSEVEDYEYFDVKVESLRGANYTPDSLIRTVGIVDNDFPEPIPTISDLALLNDTGDSDSDGITSDQRLTGFILGNLEEGSLIAEFDHNGDFVPESAVAIVELPTSFVYDPVAHDPNLANHLGSVTINYRTRAVNSLGAQLEASDWSSFVYTVQQDAASGPMRIADFRLKRDTEVLNDNVSGNPIVTGRVLGNFDGSLARIEFDRTGDEEPDEHLVVLESGEQFFYDPRVFDTWLSEYVGPMEIRYRLIEVDEVELVGDWQLFEYYKSAVPAAEVSIAELTHEVETGGAGQGAYVGLVLSGRLVDPNGNGAGAGSGNSEDGWTDPPLPTTVRVQVDHHGSFGSNTTIEGEVFPFADSTFDYHPTGISTGYHTFRFRSALWSEEHEAFSVGNWVSYSFLYMPAEPPEIDWMELRTDTGVSSTDGVTADPSIQGQLVVPLPNVLYAQVEFDLDADELADHRVSIDEQGRFSKTFENLQPGYQTIFARTKAHDPALGVEVFGSWSEFNFTYEPWVLPTPTVGLLIDDGHSPTDRISSISTLTGVVSPLVGSDLLVTFDLNFDGLDDGMSIVQSDGQYLFQPAGIPFGSASIRARAHRTNPFLGVIETGPWVPFSFTFTAPSPNQISLDDLRLARDTGTNQTDRITTDPTLTGTVRGNLLLEGVELDFDQDFFPDTTAPVSSGRTFLYTPPAMDMGQRIVSVRPYGYDYLTASRVYGNWQSLQFTLVESTTAAAEIEFLRLLSDSGASYQDLMTENSTVLGQVVDEDGISAVAVQVDINGDGNVDATVFTDNQGRFLFKGLYGEAGPRTVSFRTTKFDRLTGQTLVGSWRDFTYIWENQPDAAPLVTGINVQSDHQPGVISLSGSLTFQQDVEGLNLEIDTDGDGTANIATQTNKLGQFSATLYGLLPGMHSVQFRTSAVSTQSQSPLVSPWQAFQFEYSPSVTLPAMVESIELLNDDGSQTSDGVTTDPSLEGTVNRGPLHGWMTIELDFDGDGRIDGQSVVSSDRTWSYTPQQLPMGVHHIRARTREIPPNGSIMLGDWTSFTFTLVPRDDQYWTGRVQSMSLVHDTGLSDSDSSTSQPAVSGTAIGLQTTAQTWVDFDHNRDGNVDGFTWLNGNSFEYFPSGLPQGWIELRARLRRAELVSGWTKFEFIYHPDPDGAEAQGMAAALAASQAASQSGSSGHAGTVGSIFNTWNDFLLNEDDRFNSGVSMAAQEREQSFSEADEVYQSQYAAANAVYQSAMQNATAEFHAALASYSGDTTSFPIQPIGWPTSPPRDAGIVPADDTQPVPPVRIPEFTGPTFNFLVDQNYRISVAAARNTLDLAVRVAQNVRRDADRQSLRAHDSQVEMAWEEYRHAVLNAYDVYRESLLARPVETQSQAMEDYSAAMQAAWNEYALADATHRAIYTEALWMAEERWFVEHLVAYHNYDESIMPIWLALAQLASSNPPVPCEVLRAAQLRFTRAVFEFGKLLNIAIHRVRTRYEEALFGSEHAYYLASRSVQDRYLNAASDAAKRYDHSVANYNYRLADLRVMATSTLERTLADAKKSLDWKLADAKRSRDIQSANNLAAEVIAVETAQFNHDLAELSARRAALLGWHQLAMTPWSNYQLAVVSHELQYSQALSGPNAQRVHSLAYASRDESIAQADALWQHARQSAEQTYLSDQSRTSVKVQLWLDVAESHRSAERNLATQRKNLRDETTIVNRQLYNSSWEANVIYRQAKRDSKSSFIAAMNDARILENFPNSCGGSSTSVNPANGLPVEWPQRPREGKIVSDKPRSNPTRQYWAADAKSGYEWQGFWGYPGYIPVSEAAQLWRHHENEFSSAQFDLHMANIDLNEQWTHSTQALWITHQELTDAYSHSGTRVIYGDWKEYHIRIAGIERLLAIELSALDSALETQLAQADANQAQAVALTQSEFALIEGQLQGQKLVANAESLRDFRVTEAGHFSSRMADWNAEVESPWSQLQVQVATAIETWAAASGDAEVALAQASSEASNLHTAAVSEHRRAYLENESLSQQLRAQELAAAKQHFTLTVAQAKYDYAIELAGIVLERTEQESEQQASQAEERRTQQRNRSQIGILWESDYQRSMSTAWKAYRDGVAGETAFFWAWTDIMGRKFRDGQITFEEFSVLWVNTVNETNADLEEILRTFNDRARAAWNLLRNRRAGLLAAFSAYEVQSTRYMALTPDDGAFYVGRRGAAEKALIQATRQANVEYARRIGNAEVDHASRLASLNSTRQIQIAEADDALERAIQSADATKERAVFLADSAKRRQVTNARGSYEAEIFQQHATRKQLAANTLGSPLATFQYQAALADSIWADQQRLARDAHEERITLAGLKRLERIQLATASQTAATNLASLEYIRSMAALVESKTAQLARADADMYLENTAAEAIFAESQLWVRADYDSASGLARFQLNLAILDKSQAQIQEIEGLWHQHYLDATSGWIDYQGIAMLELEEVLPGPNSLIWQIAWRGGFSYVQNAFGWGGWGSGYQWGYPFRWGGWFVGVGLQTLLRNQLFTISQVVTDEASAEVLAYVQGVGNAMIERASALGEAKFQLAASRGAASVRRIRTINAIESAFTSTSLQAKAAYETSRANIVQTQRAALAEADRYVALDMQKASLRYENLTSLADVSRAAAVASAEVAYQTTIANEQALETTALAVLTGSPELDYLAAYSQAQANWLAATGQALVQHAVEKAIMDGRHAVHLVMARTDRVVARAEAAEAFQLAAGNADLIRSLNSTSSSINKELMLLDARNERRHQNARNQSEWEQAVAAAEKQLAIGIAGVDLEFHSARIQQVPEAERDLRKEQATADLVAQHSASIANALKRWRDAESLQRRSYSNRQSRVALEYQISKAQLDESHAIAVAIATKVRDQSMASADGKFLRDQTLAENVRRSQLALSDIQRWDVEENARLLAHQEIDVALGLPWSDYLVVAAQARLNWWSQSHLAYLGLTADRNGLETTYTDRLATASVQRAHRMAAAVATSEIAAAGRIRASAVDRALADNHYDRQVSNAALSYSRSFNLAHHTHDLALAAALQEAAYHRDPALFSQQVASAGNQMSIHLRTAELGWNAAEGAAQANKFKELTRVNRESQILAVAADISLEVAKANAERDFRQEESSAYLQSAAGWANLDASYQQVMANSFRDAAIAMATSETSPWAVLEAARTSAEAQRVASSSNALRLMHIAQATAQATNEVEQAFISAARTISKAQVSGQHRTSLAWADDQLGNALADALGMVSSVGGYQATHPELGSPHDLAGIYDVSPASGVRFEVTVIAIHSQYTMIEGDLTYGSWGHFGWGAWWLSSPWEDTSWVYHVQDVVLADPPLQVGAEFWNIRAQAESIALGNANYNFGIQRETDVAMRGIIPEELRSNMELAPVSASRLPLVPEKLLTMDDVVNRLDASDPALAEFLRSRTTFDNHVQVLERPNQSGTLNHAESTNAPTTSVARSAGMPPAESPEAEGRFYIRLPEEWNVQTVVAAVQDSARGGEQTLVPGQQIRDRFQPHLDQTVAGFDRRWIELTNGVNIEFQGDSIRFKNNGNDVYWSSAKRESFFGGQRGSSDVQIKIGVTAPNGWVRLLSGKRVTLESLQKWASKHRGASVETINEVLDALISPYFVDPNAQQLGIFIGGTNMHFFGLGNVERLYNVYEGSKFYYGGVANPVDYENSNYLYLDGGAGWGWSAILDRAVADIQMFHQPGQRIHLFGWSRGAAMVNDLAGRLADLGLQVDFMGMFDPVYSNTFPGQDSRYVESTYEGWAGNFVTADVPANVSAVAALYAINEDRSFFPATKLRTHGHTRLLTLASPGAHGEVGGHYTSNMGIQQLNLRAMIEFARGHSRATFRFRGIEEDVARIISSPFTLEIALWDVGEDQRLRSTEQWIAATALEQWSPFSNEEYFEFLNSELRDWSPGGFGFQRNPISAGLGAGIISQLLVPNFMLLWRPPQPVLDHFRRDLRSMGIERELWEFEMRDSSGRELILSEETIRRIRSLYSRRIDGVNKGWQ
jgi:hypothetical protein